MSSRYYTVYPATMASGATLTGEVNLQGSWSQVYLEIMSIATNSQLHIQAAATAGGTYRRVKHPSLNSSTVTTNDFAVASAASSALVPIPSGLKFVKVEATMAVADGASFRIHCGD